LRLGWLAVLRFCRPLLRGRFFLQTLLTLVSLAGGAAGIVLSFPLHFGGALSDARLLFFGGDFRAVVFGAAFLALLRARFKLLLPSLFRGACLRSQLLKLCRLRCLPLFVSPRFQPAIQPQFREQRFGLRCLLLFCGLLIECLLRSLRAQLLAELFPARFGASFLCPLRFSLSATLFLALFGALSL